MDEPVTRTDDDYFRDVARDYHELHQENDPKVLAQKLHAFLVRHSELPHDHAVQVVNRMFHGAKRPLHYASGGDVDKALKVVGQQQPDPVSMAQQTLSAPRAALSKGQQRLMGSFQQENRPAAVVSPKPGTGSTENTPGWSFATPDRPGEDRPPPMQAPVRDKPRLSNIADHVQKQMKTRGFRDLVRDVAGIHKMDVTPTTGSWMGQVEPSFIINGYGPNGEEATPAQIRKLSHLLGFGYQQDAVVEHHHNPELDKGVPTMYVGKGRKLVNSDLDAIHAAAQTHGLDFTRTKDGMGVKFSHYGDEKDTPEQAEQKHNEFMDKVKVVADQAGMPDRLHVRTEGDLKYAKNYLNEIFGGTGGQEGLPPGTTRSPDLFGRVVDHVLAPYARAAASEGYRLSPERLGEAYGLTPEEVNYVRKALYPVKGSDRSTVALMKEGPDAEQLDVRPTGKDGKPVVDDVLYALQNRAAAQGQIDPTDHSDSAKKMIAKNMADEVEHHVGSSDKSAIGWYDAELKKAKDKYAAVFPEIKTDLKKSLLFDTILGITSQGNDVHSNSVFAARLYNLVRDGKMSLKDATQEQAGTMGEQTKAIEYNLYKFHHLLENNSPEELSKILDKKQTVSEWKKQLKADKNLHNFDGEPLDVKGRADQKVTGWSVFGPKIGSFINNLRGDYSTLTADLWFSRSWNRLLGHNFLHTPLQEAAQYRDFRDAMHAEYAHHHPDEVSPIQPHKTRQGEVVTEKDDKPAAWLHGSDVKDMSPEEFDAHMNDPELMLEKAKEIYDKYSSPNKETGKGAYAEKSDLRRRAKNWIESRYNPVAAPRSDQERGFQQDTAEEAQKMLKRRGIDISIADIQAALWYHEKDLFGKYGVAGSRQAPASYSDAADKTVQLHQNGRLYDNWSDIQNELKAAKKAERDEARAKLKAEKDAQKAAEKAAKLAAKSKPQGEFATGGEVESSRPFDLGGNMSYPQVGDTHDTNSTIAATPRSSGSQAGGLSQQGSLRGSQGVLHSQGTPDDQSPLENLPTKVNIPRTGETLTASHDPRIRAIAASYMQSRGQQYNPPRKYVKVDPARGKRIADEYERMEHDPHHPLVKAAYDAMAKETIAQYNHAKAFGLKMEFWNPEEMEDPYAASPRLMTEDVRKNHRMYVFPTDYGYGNEPITDRDREENPMLRHTGETWNGKPVLVNDMFRAIHDYFGHAKEGVGFRGDGEENAWRSHASMYSPLARLALGTETRGQNSWLNYGPHGERNRTASTEDTVFAPPKIGLMPSWVHHEGGEDFTLPEDIRAMQSLHKKHKMKSHGGVVDGWITAHAKEARHFASGGSAMPPPKKTIKAYKLFRTDPKKPGQLFPLFVDAKTPVPIGKWVAAKAGDPGKAEGRVKSTLGDLAYRPGWHAGDLPIATHIGGKSDPSLKAPDYRPDNQVWAEVEHPADVDWQSVASSRMQFTKDGRPKPATAHITDQVPLGGFYRYKTNPNMTGNWIISGGMKVNRILGDDEVQSINDAAGTADLPRLPKAHGGTVYPLDDEAGEHRHSGGHMSWMSPDSFLDKAQEMRGDSDDKHAIKHFEKRIKEGDKLNPLALYPKGGQDGRHRATAAKHLGIDKIPVVQWPKKRDGGSIVDRALMLTSKKA